MGELKQFIVNNVNQLFNSAPEGANVIILDTTEAEQSDCTPFITPDHRVISRYNDSFDNPRNFNKNMPLSVIIKPNSLNSIGEYFKLTYTLNRFNLKLPIPYAIANDRARSFARFHWTAKWYICCFRDCILLVQRICKELGECDVKQSDFWQTFLSYLFGLTLENDPQKIETDMFSCYTRPNPLSQTGYRNVESRCRYMLTKKHPGEFSEKECKAFAERLFNDYPGQAKQLAIALLGIIADFGFQHHQHVVVCQKSQIKCHNTIHVLSTGGNQVPFLGNVTVTDQNDGAKTCPYPRWELTVSETDKRAMYTVTGKVNLINPALEDKNHYVEISKKKLLQFLIIWMVGEQGVIVSPPLTSSELNEEDPTEKAQSESIAYHFSADGDGRYASLQYREGQSPIDLPGRILIHSSGDRIDQLLARNTLDKILNYTKWKIPLFKGKLPTTGKFENFSKWVFLSSLVHLNISDKIIKEITIPYSGGNLYLKKAKCRLLRNRISKALSCEQVKHTIIITSSQEVFIH